VIITDYHACLLEVFAIISGGSTKTYKSLDIYLIIIDSYLLLSFAFFRRQKANPKKSNAVTLRIASLQLANGNAIRGCWSPLMLLLSMGMKSVPLSGK
jgi:hypothetical protein